MQIALGTVDTPQQIARLVQCTVDADALEWAIKHKNTKIRVAAISNKMLPVGLLLYASIFETSKTSRKVLDRVIHKRKIEIERALDIMKYYPQLSMDFK